MQVLGVCAWLFGEPEPSHQVEKFLAEGEKLLAKKATL